MAKVGTDTGPDQENQKRQDDNCPKSNPQSSKARQGDADRGKEEVDKDEQSGDGVCWGALVHYKHKKKEMTVAESGSLWQSVVVCGSLWQSVVVCVSLC